MTEEIVIVRHGYCIGEEAKSASEGGDDSFFTDEFRKSDSKTWPLTPLGVAQAHRAGEKIRKSIATAFDRYLLADTTRTLETARHLGFPMAQWEIDCLLRARNWNGLENIPIAERKERCLAKGISCEENSIEWKPPGGESMLTVVDSISSFLRKYRGSKARRILIVNHGSSAQAFRIIQHNISPLNYLEFVDRNGYIGNCQIVHYYHRRGTCAGVPMYQFERLLTLEKCGLWKEVINNLHDY